MESALAWIVVIYKMRGQCSLYRHVLWIDLGSNQILRWHQSIRDYFRSDRPFLSRHYWADNRQLVFYCAFFNDVWSLFVCTPLTSDFIRNCYFWINKPSSGDPSA